MLQNNKALAIVIVAIILFGQVCFSLLFFQYYTHSTNQTAERHASIIGASLWQYDRVTPLSYLSLALESNHYRSIHVLDENGGTFIQLESELIYKKSKWITSLFPITDLIYDKPIFFEEKEIGRIVIKKSPITIVYANLMFFVVMVLLVMMGLFYIKNRVASQALKKNAEKLKAVNQQMSNAVVAAEEASRSKSIFLANMSHEIRTPMNGVLGVVELLKTTSLNEQQQRYLETIKRSGDMLLAVVNDILDLSKIESGRLDINPQSFDLYKLLDEIVLPFKLEKKPEVDFKLTVADEVPRYVRTDPVRFQQLIINLLNNAFKFTSHGQVDLLVAAQKEGKAVVLNVAVNDTGMGVESAMQDVLFKPFSQGRKISSHSVNGTGLGLAICKLLLDLMGGEISFSSNPGQGTRVTFTLPIAVAKRGDVNNEQLPMTAEPRIINVFPDKHVLLVEDNAINQMILLGYLRKLDIEPTVAENGSEALDFVCKRKQHFDLIMMDCEMPVMDGFKTARSIRDWEKKEDKKPVRICAFTAHVMHEYVDECFLAGMDDYLAKPIMFETLQNYLTEIFSFEENFPIRIQ